MVFEVVSIIDSVDMLVHMDFIKVQEDLVKESIYGI